MRLCPYVVEGGWFNTVQKRSATNCLNKKALRASRNENRKVIEVRLRRKEFHRRGPQLESADLA